MTFLRIAAALAAFGLFIISPAQAQGQKPGISMADIKHVPLTRDMVVNFIASMPAMKAFSKKNKLDKPPQKRGSNPFSDFVKYLESRNLKSQADAVLGKFGFSGVRQWMNVSQSVMIAHGFSRNGKTSKQMKAEMQTMIDQISNDPRIPAEQRDALKKRFQHQMDMTLKMIPPAGNLKVVREFGPRLDAQMGRK